MVKVYDLRTNKILPPVSFTAGAKAVRIHPRTSSLIHIASQTGHFQVCDLNHPNVGFMFYNVIIMILIMLHYINQKEGFGHRLCYLF
jgi:hypothetical protein